MDEGPKPSKQELATALRIVFAVTSTTLAFLATLLGLWVEFGALAVVLAVVAVITGLVVAWHRVGHERRGKVQRPLRSATRRWLIAGLLFVLLLAATAAALLGGSASDTSSQPRILRQLGRLGAGPASIAVGKDQVWIWFRKEGRIVRLDRRTGKAIGPAAYLGDEESTLLVPGESGGVVESELPSGGITTSGGRAWVATGRNVYLLAPESDYLPLATDTAGGEALIAHGSKLWTLSPSGDVSELEFLVNGFGLTQMPSANEILDIAYGDGSVWAVSKPRDVLKLPSAHLTPDEVESVPPANRNDLIPPGVGFGERIRVRQLNTVIAFGADMLWLFQPGGRTLRRLDPGTGRLRTSLHPGFAFDDIAVNNHGLWLIHSPPSRRPTNVITWFDPHTLRAGGSIRIPGVIHDMAVDAKRLWVVVLKGPPSPWQPALLLEIAPG